MSTPDHRKEQRAHGVERTLCPRCHENIVEDTEARETRVVAQCPYCSAYLVRDTPQDPWLLDPSILKQPLPRPLV